jgi:hypothetical protein
VDDLKKLLATPRGRILAGVLAAVVVLGGGFAVFQVLGSSSGASAAQPPPTTTAATTTAAATTTGATTAATTTPAKTPVVKTPSISSSIPAPLAAPLIDHEVVVVEIYDPGTPQDPVLDDQQAHVEAIAGAGAAGAGFIAVNVRNDTEMRLVSDVVAVSSDPFLFVLDRRGKVLFSRTGYLDRDTIAQAATNALIGAEAADKVPAGANDGIVGPVGGYWEATADKILCESAQRIKALPAAGTTLASARKLLLAEAKIDSQTLQGLRAVPATGAKKASYDGLVAAYAQVAADRAAALAAVLRTPPAYAAIKRANARLKDDTGTYTDRSNAAGIACFNTPPPAGSTK